MKLVQHMTDQEKQEAFAELQVLIESAVESEQAEPAEFKLETEHRIDLVLVNLREAFGLPSNS